MDAVDENTAWVIGTDGTYSSNVWNVEFTRTFATTSDGGATWKIGELPVPSTDWAALKVSAVDANTAWPQQFRLSVFTTIGFEAVHPTVATGKNSLRYAA